MWTFGLLAVICLVTGGDWLLRLAFPITAFSYAFVWAVFAVAGGLRLNGLQQSGLFTLLAAVAHAGRHLAGHRAWRGGGDRHHLCLLFPWEGGLLHDGIDGSITGNPADLRLPAGGGAGTADHRAGGGRIAAEKEPIGMKKAGASERRTGPFSMGHSRGGRAAALLSRGFELAVVQGGVEALLC